MLAWYPYHRHRTGYFFGNPDFLRYNATANFDANRLMLGLYHRFLHLTMHMNMFVPVICALAALLIPAIASRTRLSRPALNAIAVVLLANWIAFSVLGGALLTRYLLPMYPLILLVCVADGNAVCAAGSGSSRSAPPLSSRASGSTLPTPSRPRTTSPTAT